MRNHEQTYSYRKISPKASSTSDSLPFTFPTSSNDHLRPRTKLCLNLSADRRPPLLDTSIASPQNHRPIITPKESLDKMVTQARPHTTKFSQKHFDMNVRRKKSWDEMKLPVNPSTVIKLFADQLPDWEKDEIAKYTSVYYIGEIPKSNDHALDDDNGYLNIIIKDHICFRYEIIQLLGKGTFGQVIEVYDHSTKKSLAMKIIRNQREFYEQALEEIKVLKILKENDTDLQANIVHLEENFIFRNHMVIPKQCITFELLSINLYDLLKKHQFKGISPTLIKRFSIQILQALSYTKRFHIIHCDLKPENILLVHISRSSLKVIDFGSASFENNRIQTYIQSRFYRAPEVILGIPLTTAIDMWSFGCILAELFTGSPLFAGEDEKEQLACMMEMLGPPPIEVIQIASKREYYFDKEYNPLELVNSRGRKRYPNTKDLRNVLKNADEGLVQLIEQCIRWNPSLRICPEAALGNGWLYENTKRPVSYRYGSAARTPTGGHLEEPRFEYRRNKASFS